MNDGTGTGEWQPLGGVWLKKLADNDHDTEVDDAAIYLMDHALIPFVGIDTDDPKASLHVDGSIYTLGGDGNANLSFFQWRPND